MLFNSYPFIFVFLPIMLFSFYFLKKFHYFLTAKIFLILGSLFFYGYWKLSYLLILFFSILSNYAIANLILKIKAKQTNYTEGGGGKSKSLLLFGVFFNLALLGFYKYTNFILENFNLLLNLQIEFSKIILPLALSFITFQQIGFLVDCYKNNDLKRVDFLDYLLFISFFPQLIAGPIVHHKEMIPQFHGLLKKYQKLIDLEKFTQGLLIFSIGLFKKVIIADTFAIWANTGFDMTKNGLVLNFFQSWATSLSYTFQLYFDFSGYCDMAIGLGLFFGIILPINFDSPYRSLNIKEFWKKWHMTLGRFLMQYLYIPLGGNIHGKWKTLMNLMIVFILSGIWHGAGWGFIIWGILHGGAMVTHRIYSDLLEKLSQNYCLSKIIHKIKNNLLYKIITWLITFNFINLSWIFFRSENLNGAYNLIQGMLGKGGIVLPYALEGVIKKTALFKYFLFKANPFFPLAWTFSDAMKLLIFLFCFAPFAIFFKNSIQLQNSNSKILFICVSFMLYYALIRINIAPFQEFLYFNF